jgi:hypothetical protein
MKPLATLAAASFLALAGASALAQTSAPTPAPGATPAPVPPATEQAPRGGMRRADFNALTDARIAGILAGLKLSPEQERLWPPVEQALRARAAERADRFEDWGRMMRERGQRGRFERDLDITQRLERQAEQATQRAREATERAERLTALSTAIKPFYASLDENQKRLLPTLMRERGDGGRRMGMRYHGHHADMDRDSDRRRGMDRGGMMGRGDMMERGPQRYH